MMGNEETNNRPWLGTLHRVAIYDRSVNAVQAGNIFDGQPPGDGVEDGSFQVVWVEMQ